MKQQTVEIHTTKSCCVQLLSYLLLSMRILKLGQKEGNRYE